jgi:hypothetical protein
MSTQKSSVKVVTKWGQKKGFQNLKAIQRIAQKENEFYQSFGDEIIEDLSKINRR